MQKATDILLNAFMKSADKHDWKLRLVGTVENDFNEFINDFLKSILN